MTELCSNCCLEPSTRRKLCRACYRYQQEHYGEQRPERLWHKQPNPRASKAKKPAKQAKTCLCGNEATEIVTLSIHASNRKTCYDEPLCAECADIERSLTHVYA